MTRKLMRLIFLSALISACVLTLLSHPGSARLAGAPSGRTAAPQVFSRADGGEWNAFYNTKDVPVHISLLPDGRLLYWGRDKEADGWDASGHSNTFTVDPLYLDDISYTAVPSPTPPTNLFCSGHSFLPDGRLIVAGGHIKDPVEPKREAIGDKAINIFDYRTNRWTHMPPDKEMETGRWYPYNVTMPSGDTLIVAGKYRKGTTYPIATDDNKEPSLRNLQGNVSTLRQGFSAPRVWTYPYLSLAPDGRVFIAKPSPAGSTAEMKSLFFDPYAPNNFDSFGVFTEAASPASRHWEGTSVMYAPGRMLLIGGSQADLGRSANVAAVESIDLNQPTPVWGPISSMAQPRQFPTATLLPDGKVLVTGGTSCGGVNRLDCGPNSAVQTPELWDPANPSQGWRQMNPTTSSVPRVYHSVALLLPDARVLVGGGGLPAAAGEQALSGAICAGTGPDDTEECRRLGHKNVEIFSPPYLYNSDGSEATRPSIVTAPESLAYGQLAQVGLGNVSASEIGKVVLIRLPSVTHTYNQDQRRVELNYSVVSSDLINVTAPPSPVSCPPGPYMMFVIARNNNRNTPSVARIVRVGNLSISPTNQGFLTTSQQGSLDGVINVTATPGLNWMAQPDADARAWVTITSGATGAGSGTVRFSVAPNTAPGAVRRKGKIIVSIPSQEGNGYEFMLYQSVDFTDVAYVGGDPTFSNAMNQIYAREITSGCSADKYCPYNSVSRAEVAVFLTRALRRIKDAPPEPVSPKFTDVPPGYWAGSFIDYIARRRITNGNGFMTYGPENAITRAEMAVLLIRCLGIFNPPPPTNRFNDVPSDYWAAPFIDELARRGITRGGSCGTGNFCPGQPVRRDEMAVFLVRTFGL